MKACQICLSTFEDSVRFCPFHGTELKPLPDRQFLPGETVCSYYLEKCIGHDGLGDIFLATRAGNTFRLRLYSNALLCDSGRVSRLHELLERSVQIQGGGIPVVDFDWFDDGALYSAHPFIPGNSFQDILNLDVSLTESHVAELLLQLLRAVKDIHNQRLIDGNIALSNIILDNSGRVRLHDVGLWDVFRGDHFSELRDDHPEIFEDVVDLMAPEVAKGEQPQAFSDVYSCGAAACCLLMHQSGVGTAAERIAKHLNGDAFDLRHANPRVRITDDFSDLLYSSTLGSSGVRFQTTRAFMTALMSIHSELDDSNDSLTPELLDLLSDGKARPDHQGSHHSAFSSFPDNQWDELHPNEVIEKTRKGIDSDRTVVEKASWADLAQLVGDNLETTALTDVIERAVTTEMDPFEASPTTEIPKTLFNADEATGINKVNSLDNLLNSLGGEAQKDSAHEANEDEILPGLHVPEIHKKQDKTDEIIKSESNDADAPKTPDTSSDKVTLQKEETSKADSATTLLAETPSKTDAKKDVSLAKDSVSNEFPSQPHKRINRKKSEDSEDASALESGDVISVSNNMEMRRIKRKRRRNFEPQAEIITSDVDIEPMTDPKAKPDFSPMPTLTSTHGYTLETDKSHENGKIPTVEEMNATLPLKPLKGTKPKDTSKAKETPKSKEKLEDQEESGNEEMDWFDSDDEAKPAKHNKKKTLYIALIAICVLGIACIVVGLHKFGSSDSGTDISHTPEQSAKIQAFHDALEKSTPESRQEAEKILKELRKLNVERSEIKEFRHELSEALQGQAAKLRQSLAKSETIPNPFDYSKSDIDAAYISCTTAVDMALPDAETQMQACEVSRQASLDAAQANALAQAALQRPELKKQFDGWTELGDIYAMLQKGQQNHPIPNLKDSIEETNAEKSAYQQRLEMIPENAVAAADVPAKQPENSDGAGELAAPGGELAAAPGIEQPAPKEPAPAQPAPEEPAPAQTAPAPIPEPVIAKADPAPAAPAPVQPAPVVPAPVQQAKAEPTHETKPAPKNTEPAKQAANTNRNNDSELALKLIESYDASTKTAPKANNSAPAPTPAPAQPSSGTPNKADTKPAPVAANQPAAQPKETAKPVETAANTAPKAADKPKTADAAPAAAGGNVPTSKLINDASAALAKKDFDTAISLLTQATKQDPNNAMAWYRLAQANEKQGKIAQACTYAEKSCKLSKKVTCYNYLGSLREKAGMASEAQEAYKKALEIDPNDPTAKSKVH